MHEQSGWITLSDVAAHAGVSLATASRALNGSTRTVTLELRDRVEASARELGYVANAQAQAVARGSSQTVALVLGDIADPYFAGIAAGVIVSAKRHRLTVTMTTTSSDPAEEREMVAALRGQQPRAILLAASRQVDQLDESRLDAELTPFEALGGRVAFLGESARARRGARVVEVRNREGAHDLAISLVGLGYTDFVILAGSALLITPVDRAEGFVDGLASEGIRLPAGAVLHGPFSRDGGYQMLTELLQSGRRPQCVFAVTDVMAMGAMAAVRDHGLQPGIDVAVAGFDDIPTLNDVHPHLTTVALPLLQMGERSLELALADTADAEDPITGTVRLRSSTPGR